MKDNGDCGLDEYPYDADSERVLAARAALILPTLDSIEYLLNAFEQAGGAWTDDDVLHHGTVARWLNSAEDSGSTSIESSSKDDKQQ